MCDCKKRNNLGLPKKKVMLMRRKVDLRYSSNTRLFRELIGHWGLQACDSTLILINWCLALFYWWSWQLLCTSFLGHRFGLCLLLINVQNLAKHGKKSGNLDSMRPKMGMYEFRFWNTNDAFWCFMI